MVEAGRVNDLGSDLIVRGLALFECCCCHSSRHDPIQLKCLHYYCRSCFHLNYSGTPGSKLTVTCPACFEVTEVSSVVTNRFLSTYKRASAVRAETVCCDVCKKYAKEEMAEFWCVVCAESLCVTCFARHNKFTDGHRIFELEYARILPLRQLTQAVQCNLHWLAMQAHCFTCCFPKCAECLESCAAGSHDLHLLSDEVTQEHISSVTKRVIDTAKRLGSLLPVILQKCRALASRLQSGRTSGHRMLVTHRRRLHDSTFWALDTSAGEVYCDMQSRRYERPVVMSRGVSRSCAANIEALDLSGVRSVQILVVRHLLKTVAAYCCLSGRSSIRRLLQKRVESGSLSICGSVSLTSDIMLNACLGSTNRRRAALRALAPLNFDEAFVSFQTPVACWDLAVTRDGHVLLAALEHGLLVYSDRGQQLSSWRPERRSNGKDDAVSSVAMLSEGRAAVSLVYAQLVVLLRGSKTGDTWLEDRRVAVLTSPPRRLAVHGDLLAATECRSDAQQQPQMWVPGSEVKLLRLSSGQVLYTHSRDYVIQNVALTALCVITTSLDSLRRSKDFSVYVVDAFSHSGQFLWRYETSPAELVWGLCVSADTWSWVYITVWRRDRSSRVMAISGADGRDCREVMSSGTHGLQLPAELSLARGEQRTVLAVLNWDEKQEQLRSVSLCEALM